MIALSRKPSFADAGRSYKIVMDGHVIGKIKRGETLTLPTPSLGPHKICVTIDWCSSNELNFIFEGVPIAFSCESNLQGIKIFFAIFYLFMPSKWCLIKQI